MAAHWAHPSDGPEHHRPARTADVRVRVGADMFSEAPVFSCTSQLHYQVFGLVKRARIEICKPTYASKNQGGEFGGSENPG